VLPPQVKPPACAGTAAARAPNAIAEMRVRFIINSIPVAIAMVADRQRKPRANWGSLRDAVVNEFGRG